MAGAAGLPSTTSADPHPECRVTPTVVGTDDRATGTRQPRIWPISVALVGALLFATAYTRGVLLGTLAGWDLTSVLLLGVASACLIYGLTCAEQTGRITAPRWLAWTGGASYSIYLVHFPALSFLAKLWIRAGLRDVLPAPATALLFICLAVGAGCLFHLIVERPLLRWLQPRRGRPRVPASGQSRFVDVTVPLLTAAAPARSYSRPDPSRTR